MNKPKRAGRPRRQLEDGERTALGLRVSAHLKRRLEAEADLSGRSQSQEAELRLLQSFRDDDVWEFLSSPTTRALFNALRQEIEVIEDSLHVGAFRNRQAAIEISQVLQNLGSSLANMLHAQEHEMTGYGEQLGKMCAKRLRSTDQNLSRLVHNQEHDLDAQITEMWTDDGVSLFDEVSGWSNSPPADLPEIQLKCLKALRLVAENKQREMNDE